MLLELRGQLTCSGCSRSIVIGESWLAAAAKANDGILLRSDLHRLICKQCGIREPTYVEPTRWATTSDDGCDAVDERLRSVDEPSECPFDFYYYDELLAEDGTRSDYV